MHDNAASAEMMPAETIRQYPLFGANVCLAIKDAQENAAEAVMDDAYALGLCLQAVFNIYDPRSELSLLNRKRAMRVSQELLHVLLRALEFCRLSGGEYDIAKGRQFLQRKRGEALSATTASYRDITVEGDMVKLQGEGAWIDLGSIAKGYIAERMAASLRSQGIESGYVDARGDIRFFGEPALVGVKHPRDDGTICAIRVKDKGVATSGDYRQFHKSFDESHILNKKLIISATVVADDLADADAYATLLMVCEDDVRERIIEEFGIVAMTVDAELRIRHYNGFERLVVGAEVAA